MALSSQLKAAYFIEFFLAIAAIVIYGLLWFFLYLGEGEKLSAVSKEGLKVLKKAGSWFKTANIAFWIALLGMAFTLLAMSLALVAPIDGRNTFILRTAQVFPVGNECTQAFVDDGICAVWARWIFYTIAFALFTIALGMYFSIKSMWLVMLVMFNIASNASIALATIIGDSVASFFAWGFGVLFAAAAIGILGWRLFAGVTTVEIESLVGKFFQRWLPSGAIILAWVAYPTLWFLGPAGIKVYSIEVETWIFLAADSIFLLFVGLIMAWAWRSTDAATHWKDNYETFRAKITPTRKSPSQKKSSSKKKNGIGGQVAALLLGNDED